MSKASNSKSLFIYDIEQFKNYHCNIFKSVTSNRQIIFEISQWKNDLVAYIDFLEKEVSGLIGYNNLSYDYPMVHYILTDIKDFHSNKTGLEINKLLYNIIYI